MTNTSMRRPSILKRQIWSSQTWSRQSWLTHAAEQAITNVLYAILVGAICVVLFS